LKWFDTNFELAYNTNVALTYVLVGGAFYAGLAAGPTLWLSARKSKRTAGKHGTETPSQA